MLTPDTLFKAASTIAFGGWLLLLVAPRWRGTRAVVLSGALPLLLAAAYAGLITTHYLGPHGTEGGFNSLAEVAALFRDPWALLAGWVHYLCFDMWVGAWEVRDAQPRAIPHLLLIPCLLLTFLFGPVGLLLYHILRLRYPAPIPAP
jgi:hypothetical protein